MKTTWDELMRYAPEQEIPLPSMQDGECARILNKTMGKIKETKQKPARPVRTVLIAAAVAALLCGSAFAAHSFGWFDRLFGEKAALVKEHVTSYDEKTSTDITQPTYTEEEQAMIVEGTMQVPDIAASVGYGRIGHDGEFRVYAPIHARLEGFRSRNHAYRRADRHGRGDAYRTAGGR